MGLNPGGPGMAREVWGEALQRTLQGFSQVLALALRCLQGRCVFMSVSFSSHVSLRVSLCNYVCVSLSILVCVHPCISVSLSVNIYAYVSLCVCDVIV